MKGVILGVTGVVMGLGLAMGRVWKRLEHMEGTVSRIDVRFGT